MTWNRADDADWSALTVLTATYDAFRDNYVPFVATTMIWLMPTFLLDGLGVSPRVVVLYEFLVGGLLVMGMAPSVAESLLGHPVPLRDCLLFTVTKLRPGSLALVVIVQLAVGGALLLLVLPGLWLLAAWSVAGPALTAEKLSVTAALRRSMTLTRGRIVRVAIAVTAFALIAFFLIMGGRIAGTAVSGPEDPTGARLMAFVVDAIVMALVPCLTTVLYSLLRFDKEGITLELVTDTLH
jgi:hypothetical protein